MFTRETMLNHTIKKGNHVVESNMEGEKVLFHINSGTYYNLGIVGGDIWSRIDGCVHVKTIVSSLMTDYDVTYGTCMSHVTHFLIELYDEDMINAEPLID